MLEGIFGNKTAEKVLLHIYHYGESYALAISEDLNIPNNPVVKQLERFEKAQILSSKKMGRTRIYRFNERFPLTSPIIELIKRTYDSLPQEKRNQIFATRRRPRTKGKPVL
jgi:predicted transcriptional regulator